MTDQESHKHFGIRCRLSPDDPMSAAHLLGPDWEAYRWYDTEQQRDGDYEEYSREHIYSRRGDRPSVIYTKITR
jgi:hypothetical protein